MKALMKKLPLFFMICLVFCAALLAPFGGGEASAATDAAPTSIDETNALDDLEGSILNGKEFNKDDFAQSDVRDPQIISLVEYGYSFYTNRQNDYGLYLYIYNPHVQAFDNDPARNQIHLKAGELASDKYDLQFLNYSTEVGYEGLFYKFKIALTDTEKQQVLNGLTRTERIYKVTEFELVTKGAVTSYTCATTYTYTGFAQGYGSELAADESTLACAVDGFDEYVELNVHQTVYRPQGDYYEGEQSQLNSCYFRVPEKYFTQYGELSKIVCEWWEYVTQPMLVTEDLNLYTYLHNLYGENATALASPYFILAGLSNNPGGLISRSVLKYISNYANFKEEYIGMVSWKDTIYGDLILPSSTRFDNFAAVFYSGQGKSYTDTYISAEEVKKELLQNSQHLDGSLYAGQYSASLFTNDINPGHTRGYNKKEITPNDEKPIFWNYTTKDFWQKIFGGYDVDTIYENIKAITTINSEDLQGDDAEIAAKLYINENDVQNLKNEYEKAQSAKDKERLVLLRYSSGNYTSMPCISTIQPAPESDDVDLAYNLWINLQTGELNGYLAQEPIYANFDIISLWFKTENAETEIPVAMTPQDVFAPLTPPLEENYQSDSLPWWIWLLLACIVIIIVVVLLIFLPVLRPIFQFALKILIYIILAPFYLIGWIIKAIANAVKRRQKTKAAAPPKVKAPKDPGKGTGTGQQEQHIVLEVRQQKPKASKTKTKAPAAKALGKAQKKTSSKKVKHARK